MSEARRVLIIDNEVHYAEIYKQALLDRGFQVELAHSIETAQSSLASQKFDLVAVDVILDTQPEQALSTRAGYQAGVYLAQWIKANHPDVKVIGYSGYEDPGVISWFQNHTEGFCRRLSRVDLGQFVSRIFDESDLRPFIVHGHDSAIKLELKNFLQNSSLRLPEPVILHEKANMGRSLIEKFEDESFDADVVFVLLTPDDEVLEPASKGDASKRRSRPNVIFELGYFFGHFGRRSGQVILLYKKGPEGLDIPSDIHGLVYIDISDGIEAASEQIRREVERLRRRLRQ